jgi:molybdopterin synthase catalytic subunit
MIRISHDPIDFTILTESVRSPLAGAVVLFLGTVREVTGAEITVALTYDAYMPMALKQLGAIETEVRERWPITNISLIHRLGRLDVSEVSVAVAVSAPHRGTAFEAARYAIDTLKEVVPIWKQDHLPSGTSQWIHPA